jgi:hypothetical protein
MKRPYLTFDDSHAMASAVDGTMPGVSADDYARHTRARAALFSDSILVGAIRLLQQAGHEFDKPEGVSKGQWNDLLLEASF